MKLPLALVLGSLSLATLRAAPPAFEESFSQAKDGAPLKEQAGWSVHYGPGTAEVSVAAGFSGLGVRVQGNEQFRLLVPEDRALPLKEGGGELRLKLRIMADNDGYALTQVLFGQNDGVHGVVVRFNGGTHDGSADNFIQVSSGGDSWGKTTFETIPDSAWKKDVWYEIALTVTSSDQASVSIREADSGPVLVEQHTVGVVGPSASFTTLNAVVIGNAGTARTFDFDDLSLNSL